MAVASSQGSVQAPALGMPKLARMPESALIIPVAQPSSSRTPLPVHTRTSVHHECVPYMPLGLGRYNSMPRSIIVSINLVPRNFDNYPQFGAICNGLGTFLPFRCCILSPSPGTVGASLHLVVGLDPNTIWKIILQRQSTR